jgi:hypothetical protein
MSDTAPAPVEYMIFTIRDQRVMLDADLAALYGVATKVLNQAVRRHAGRFPIDFAFKLTAEEWANLKSQFLTSSESDEGLRSQFVTSNRGGRRYLPVAFTQEGVAMLSGILNSPRAIEVNIEIMRAFVRLRKDALSYAELNKRIDSLEENYDERFATVFDVLRELMKEPDSADRRIGFRVRERRKRYQATLR